MKKLLVSFMLVACCTSLLVYRYGLASAVCDNVKDKLECSSEWARIIDEQEACRQACPTKDDWYAYCEENEIDCEISCDQLNTAAEREACMKKCIDQEQSCKKSYTNKAGCETKCDAQFKTKEQEFNSRWKK